METKFEVNKNEYLQECDSRDVISFDSQNWVSIEKMQDIICQSFCSAGIANIVAHIANISNFKNRDKINYWFENGEECEILRAGSKGWQKGKLKINVSLEFIPDEIEEATSPLDDIRQADINNSAQQ